MVVFQPRHFKMINTFVAFLTCLQPVISFYPGIRAFLRHKPTIMSLSTADGIEASLMPDPMPNSIGNFFENKTDDMSFIQCYMTSMCKINGVQYGVGFPVDMPVMLTYFEGNELMPVRPDYPDFDHLVNHVSVQMDYNDFQLYKTPVVLTLQGEFEDEFMNEILPTPKLKRARGMIGKRSVDDDEEDEDVEDEDDEEVEEDDDDEEWEEITVDELIKLEGKSYSTEIFYYCECS